MKKIEARESALLRAAGVGAWARVLRSVFYRHKKWRVTAYLFETDASVKKYWSVTIFENGVEVFHQDLFDVEKEKTVEDLRKFLFEFLKIN